ncbi:MAG: bifunctional diaminohydroxyphosphoribosylaminopyrimidine deaminase/5-amino-6-(5-phosphoribosylamino)uracil reductase RibD [Clostridia bacterium]|nr:MAG: bifunctional diaminohydroxyphosphoribosylaminopyrimidine deaminase/5-amino-6-(5-phosphoribosylamino)uracil reductase RibD [Clostridia bacterium]
MFSFAIAPRDTRGLCLFWGYEMDDISYMQLALDLARQGLGYTSPNPAVGAVVVSPDGEIVGRGYHHRAGEAHAEINALQEAGARARGATLYVTLEPCSHYGRTPPCVRAVIAAGVARVVAAMVDPNPLVAGRGLAQLADAGLMVQAGVMAEQARELNEMWVRFVTAGRPWVSLKAAVSLDGKLATARGDSRWITGWPARSYGHWLRQIHDAVLVGIGTVLADDPLLTVRLVGKVPAREYDRADDQAGKAVTPGPGPVQPSGSPGGEAGRAGRNPVRVILDSRLRLPVAARVVTVKSAAPTLVATTRRADPDRREALRARGVEILVVEEDAAGRVSLPHLAEELARRGIASILVEGGAEVHAGFLEAGLVDKVYFFLAPRLIGGREAPGAIGGRGAASVAAAARLSGTKVDRLGEDLLVTGYPVSGLRYHHFAVAAWPQA